ncbi:MAG TPA: hypothetical protein VIJ97_07895, partial [Candidatus Anoxymicrobiaceae bacterium]
MADREKKKKRRGKHAEGAVEGQQPSARPPEAAGRQVYPPTGAPQGQVPPGVPPLPQGGVPGTEPPPQQPAAPNVPPAQVGAPPTFAGAPTAPPAVVPQAQP